MAARFRTTFAVAFASLAAAAAPAHAIGFAGARPSYATFAQTSYTGLLQAIRRHSIRSATVDERAHVATVTYADGRGAVVRYPAADATLPVRMADVGVDVQIAAGSSSMMPALELVFGLLLAVAVGVALRRRPGRSSEDATAS